MIDELPINQAPTTGDGSCLDCCITHDRGFTVAKAGNSREQNDDAWTSAATTGRFAVADGATTAYDSGRWAKLLTDDFTAGALGRIAPDDLATHLDRLANIWRCGLAGDRLPWYKQEKAARGAAATLLGLSVASAGPSLTWRAIAIGDSCLFHVRQKGLVAWPFPIERVGDFGDTPPLLSTNPTINQRGLKSWVVTGGRCQSGDIFLLATDALAAYFVAGIECGERRWLPFLDLKDDGDQPVDGAFQQLIDELRQQHRIHNDDTTLVVIRVGADLPENDRSNERAASVGYPSAEGDERSPDGADTDDEHGNSHST